MIVLVQEMECYLTMIEDRGLDKNVGNGLVKSVMQCSESMRLSFAPVDVQLGVLVNYQFEY